MKLFIMAILLFTAGINAQQKNTLITDEKTGKPMLIGFIDRAALTDTAFTSWFDPEFKEYDVDVPALDGLANKMKDITITMVLGTWCSDSHMQVPRFLKILDVLNYPEEKVTMIAVDRHKEGQSNETADLDIKAVPTFIIFRNSTEIGRIVESPEVSLEKDLAKIISASQN